MFQRLNLLIRLVGLYLSRKKGMALLERIQSSTLGAEDRDRVIQIVRAMLRLPEDPVQAPSAPKAPLPARPTPAGQATRQRQSAKASRRRQRPAP